MTVARTGLVLLVTIHLALVPFLLVTVTELDWFCLVRLAS